VRHFIQRKYLGHLENGRRVPVGPGERVVVFAPHPDDETLGCGGTIAAHRRAGAEVAVVVLTDGSRSHSRLMDPALLGPMRAEEVRAATATLGVPPDRLHLLNYPDGQLVRHADEARQAVEKLLVRYRPTQVYLPSRRETPADHLATFEVVAGAVTALQMTVTSFEYPVWFWMQWPFTSGAARGKSRWPRFIAKTIRDNARLLTEFRDCMPIDQLLDLKNAALRCHATQMTRLVEGTDWSILEDVGAGAFLGCLLQPVEVFHRVEWTAGSRAPGS
jgi:LmbE family N-acetylglucosaminyl deacetylase